MARFRVTFVVLSALLVFLAALPALSQVSISQAQLNGTVRDQTGSLIVKATVTLRDVDTNRVYTATSNTSGYYILANLPPGNYELTAEAPGFGKYKQTGFVLNVGQVATIDIGMKVAQASEELTVNTEAPIIEPTRTEVSQVIATQQIQSLPISGRLFTDFALLSPGVTTGRIGLQSTFTDPSVTRISFGGQRDLNNSVTVDGADNINTATGSQRATPSQEAVSEFRVVNNSFGAEYGRALGGIVNIVTKSGTNDVHGSIYEYLENNAVNARSILTQPGFDVLRQNQFGGTLGGPIRKNKTFYFLNYEGQRRGQSPTYPGLLVSNLAAINALKASYGIAPENLGVLKTADVDNGFVKLDHQLNPKNNLSLRYSIQDGTDLNMLVGETLDGGGIGAPSSGRNGLLRDQATVGTWTWQLSDTKVNETLVQWARRNYGFPGVTGQPNLDVPNLLLFGHNFGAFDRYNETRIQFTDNLSAIHNKHYMKFGFDTNYIRNFVIWPGFTPARIIFPSLGDMLASGKAGWGAAPCPPPLVGLVSPCIAAFFWGAPIGPGPFNPNAASPPVPTTWQNAFLPSLASDFFVHLNHSYYGFFAQDQWHITRKLTFNYGVRYDFETGLGFFINSDYKEFQPRVGLAYSPDSRTVIRAGYGIFNDKYNLTFFFVPAPQRQPMITGLPFANNQITGTWLLNSMFLPTPCVLAGCPAPPPGASLPPGTVPPPLLSAAFENLINSGSFPNNSLFVQGGTSVSRNLLAPYSEQTSLEIDRELVKGLTVSAGYMFVAGHHLVRPIDLNVGPPIGAETGTGKLIYNFAINDPNIPAPPGGSHGTNGIFYFTDSTGNSVYHGMTLQLSEKAGKYFSLNANYTLSHTLDDGTFVTFVSTPQSNRQRNLERANSNQDARHRFVTNFVADAPQQWKLLRNFELSSIVTLQSGRPFTLFVGFDANNDGNPVTDRVGTSPRNSYRGDSLQTVDMRLSRAIHFDERRRLNLSIDAFNLFNRANVDEVFSVYGAPDFIGAPPVHFGDGIAGPSGQVGAPRTVFNPRQLQFAAKFMF
ncbi:MAG TPA: carboxypeptidase regulatory-like domain-containing protein [Candidatus Angelobacter sp.]|nr:carboxypeptidase regulatory-like domain-containing protein [Candidatus Angelobacter sp.]